MAGELAGKLLATKSPVQEHIFSTIISMALIICIQHPRVPCIETSIRKWKLATLRSPQKKLLNVNHLSGLCLSPNTVVAHIQSNTKEKHSPYTKLSTVSFCHPLSVCGDHVGGSPTFHARQEGGKSRRDKVSRWQNRQRKLISLANLAACSTWSAHVQQSNVR